MARKKAKRVLTQEAEGREARRPRSPGQILPTCGTVLRKTAIRQASFAPATSFQARTRYRHDVHDGRSNGVRSSEMRSVEIGFDGW